MNEIHLRVKACLNKELPVPCGSGCLYICCDPIITTTFIPKKLLFEPDLKNLKSEINGYIDSFVNTKDLNGKKIIKFEGIFFTGMNDENQFTSEHELVKLYKEIKQKSMVSAIELSDFKKQFQLLHAGVIFLFTCSNYDKISKGCSVYEKRPGFCREFNCEQLNTELVSNDYKKLYLLVKNKATNLNQLKNNYSKDIETAVHYFLQRQV